MPKWSKNNAIGPLANARVCVRVIMPTHWRRTMVSFVVAGLQIWYRTESLESLLDYAIKFVL